ncbi:MAG: TetR/AcrR family transcriptional regulator [Proteobacteria bacterium]|nr:TetR/AcrR family transcriptional regulator [Pseudomonadota bacterium]MCP4918755.1 TetR/AcrR family transcriptional regulator [Pseudomonadota bacterium]
MNAVDVRTRILREATRLFAERGVSGTSIQAVATAAGITKPTLVYHFGGKDGLRTAVLAEFMDHWRHELPKLLTAAASGGPRLDSLVEALFDFFRRDPDRARLLLRESLDRPEELRTLLRDSVQPFTALITQAMRMGQMQGAIREKVDPEAFVVLVISCAVGVVAVGPFVSGLMSPEPSVDAQQAELIRMARVALLNPPGST